MVDVRLVHQHDLPEIWPLVRQNVIDAAVFSNGRYTDKTAADEVLAGSMQLWVIIEDEEIITSFITQVMRYPTGIKCCDIYALGGNSIKKWLKPAIDAVSEWAEAAGCSSIEFVGRPGWEKMLKNWGKLSIMMELPIGDNYGRRG